ncbi:acyl-CoA dehydrogenase [Natronocella acetinitrilica]|uniref:Acyl-coenzyme A dehydrogenase n=1 Tax=Natronocella acetinitrilica TaxID=414046 RepID=A0AAE3KBN8_9GAMM|nr:acyl-CoA dehydrogenase [Natronocella acetinitrilica]MCP1674944.1 acyl-CoA dehydrogenase [Natronocella acetinitrilica]
MATILWLIGLIGLSAVVAYAGVWLLTGTAIMAVYLALMTVAGPLHWTVNLLLWLLFALIAIPLNVEGLRRRYISRPLFHWFGKVLPAMSETEREAIEAGTVWWDGQLFSGNPDWDALLHYPSPRLSDEEQTFLDGPTEDLCRMTNEWDVTFKRMDLSPETWDFIRSQGFLGLIIPKEYGGKGFSAIAHSEIAMKLASRCSDLGSTVMVPNSLGPAELLMHYGTEAQRSHYLPRLARGEEIPCFALTSPEAGSDAAGSMRDYGIVCKGDWQGEEVIGLRLTWEKRYITLGPVATLLGLAFRAYDPDGLLGDEPDLGITLALIPTKTPGVNIGRRHFPLNAAFMNGPNSGKDVFIPLDWIIGGRDMVGKGWMMLMNCLSVGRSISLPAGGTGAAKACALHTGAYARVRRQFKMPIGEFEGIQEALARIGGLTYLMDAARTMTAGAVDLGEKPSVLSAVVKYHLTEGMRQCVNDAMDVHGGKGICLGPNNYLGRTYQTAPISITVEGANILTRNMMIFGQGAIRCHPFVLREMLLTREADQEQAAEDFDALLMEHLGFGAGNAARSLLLGLTGGGLLSTPGGRSTRRYYRQLTRLSAAFALLADCSMLVLGGSLKRRERISARLGDVLSYLYLGSACLKRYEDQGRPSEDLPLLQWAMAHCLSMIELRLDEVLKNFPDRVVAAVLRPIIFPLGRRLRGPDDRTGAKVARLLMEPNPALDRLVAGAYRSADPEDGAGAVLHAVDRVIAAAPIEARVQKAIKEGALQPALWEELADAALAKGLISDHEAATLREADAARRTVIAVDDFSPTDVLPGKPRRKQTRAA